MRKYLLALSLSAVASPLYAQDIEGQDYPLVPRYAGSMLANYRQPSLDEISLPTGIIADEAGAINHQRVTGRVTHLDYRITPATAPLQIERHYTDVLARNGFKVAFSCSSTATCGQGMGGFILNSGKVAPQGFADGLFNDRLRVLLARKGDTYVLLHIIEGPDRSLVYQSVVEQAKPAAGS